MKSSAVAVITFAASLCLSEREAVALPTMVRLGYTNCAACHISPQGGGLLNLYGRSVDEAQSLRAGEYEPRQDPWIQALSWGGRITQDFRAVLQEQDISTSSQRGTQLFWSRLMYRNATDLGKGWRISTVVTGYNDSVLRSTSAYNPPVNASEVFVNTALISYRPATNVEVAVGRDQLPSGINLPDLSFFIKARNSLGYYDAPTQAKVFWWGKRYQIDSYVFGPGGNERSGFHESGAGTLAEVDLLGKQRTVVGVNLLRGVAASGDRTLVGPYARLGFGKWGILAEHDITERTYKVGTPVSFQQQATYGQLFWAPREWLVTSLIGERLSVQPPFLEERNGGRIEVTARLASQVTIGVSARLQQDAQTGRLSRSLVLQLSLKTVN